MELPEKNLRVYGAGFPARFCQALLEGVILTGEAAPVDLQALQAALAPRFYAVAVRDETRPRKDLWQDAADDTLRGLFLQALKAQYDAAPDDAARRTIALAARLGTAAMDGREMDA